MKTIQLIGRGLMMAERAILVAMLSAMILLAFAQIVLRNLFGTSFFWADPLLRHLVLWIGFFGAGIAAQEEKHISLDLISRFASPRLQHIVRIVAALFAAAVCGLLTNAGWTFLLSERENADELFNAGGISYPVWWFQVIIPAGFALLALHFVLKAIEHALGGGATGLTDVPPEPTTTVPLPGVPTGPN